MSESFDPYVAWLGITDAERPLSHYRLLGLSLAESDRQAILTAADAALARVRKVRPGGHIAAWQRLLDELNAAKQCLCDAAQKADYDARLRARATDAAPTRAAQTGAAPTRPSNPNLMPPRNPDMLPPTFASAKPAAGPQPSPAAGAPGKPSWPAGDPMAPIGPLAAEEAPAHSASSPPDPAFMPPRFDPPPARTPASPMPGTLYPSSPFASSPFPNLPSAEPHKPASPAWPSNFPPLRQEPYSPPESEPDEVTIISGPPTNGPAIHETSPGGVARASSTPDYAAELALMTSAPLSITSLSATAVAEPPAHRMPRPIPLYPLPRRDPSWAPVDSQGKPIRLENRQKLEAEENSRLMLIGACGGVLLLLISLGLFAVKHNNRPGDGGDPSLADLDGSKHSSSKQPGKNESDHSLPDATDHSDDHSTTHSDNGDQTNDDHANTPPVKSNKPDKPDEQPDDAMPDDMTPDDSDTMKPDNPDSMPATDKPPMPNPNPNTNPPSDPEQSAAFNKGIKAVRAALAARDVKKAKTQLDALAALSLAPDQEKQLARVQSLHDYVDGFWKAVQESLKGLQSTDELKIGNTIVAVVDADPDSLSIRMEGGNRNYTLANMPAGICVALAQRWFDEKAPTTKVFLGAFQAVDPNGDVQEARRLWEEATLAGAPVTDLMPLLDEKVGAAPAEPAPVPDYKDVAKAERALKALLAKEFQTAKTAQRRLEVAKQLVERASMASDPAERYVMLREARELAASYGSPALMLHAIDVTGDYFEVDPLALKVDALAKIGSGNLSVLVAKAVARGALDLIDEAAVKGGPTVAGKLAKTALIAARKSKDPLLVKQANARAKEFHQSTGDDADKSDDKPAGEKTTGGKKSAEAMDEMKAEKPGKKPAAK